MKVYFVTHATSEDNEAGIASGWNYTKLSHLGIQQAKECGNTFKDVKIDLVFCSDLRRAVDTVRLAFGNEIPFITDRRLREINYGDLNGKPADIVDPVNKKRIDEPFPNGESYQQALSRIHNFCRELKEKHAEETVLIVGHRATQFGLDTFAGKRTIEECLSTPFTWQPYWEYRL